MSAHRMLTHCSKTVIPESPFKAKRRSCVINRILCGCQPEQTWHAGLEASQFDDVRQVTPALEETLVKTCLRTISSALDTDASTQYFCIPGQQTRFYTSVIRAALKFYPDGTCLYSLQEGSSVAMCYQFPHATEPPWFEVLQHSLTTLALVRPDRWMIGSAAADFFEYQRQLYFKENGRFLYIVVMATHPSRQCQGLGAHLLQYLTSRADAAGQHCYLEATCLRNRALYLRHGFKQLRVFQPRADFPPTYLMGRPPVGVDEHGVEEGVSVTAVSD